MENNTIKTFKDMEIYENEIYMLCDEYVNSLHDPNMIYNNRNLINGLLKYLYKTSVCKVLNNLDRFKSRYENIDILYELWNIYINILGMYSKDLRPTINQYCIFTNINRDTLNKWFNKYTRDDILTPKYYDFVQKLRQEIESHLLQGNGVMEIFELKSIYGYNDNLASIPLDRQDTINANNLPVFEAPPNNAIEDTKNCENMTIIDNIKEHETN